MAQNNLPLHPRERLPHTAPEILNSKPNSDWQHGRFFITNKEFEMRVNLTIFRKGFFGDAYGRGRPP